MLEHDFERFSAVMLGVAENYGQSLSSEGISVRFKALASYAIGEIERAALSIIVCRKYTSMPTIADFLEHMGGGSAEDKAEVEAGKVLTAIAKHGAYASVVFDDSVTQAVIVQAYGGWVKLCQDCGVEESEKWFRKDFAKIWAAYSRQSVKQSGHLPGIFEITNCSSGHFEHVPPPKLIGDPVKARAVLEAGNSSVLSLEASSLRGECHSLAGLLETITEERKI
ncbi:MAG: hypothetical protein DELT_02959 [Desulfovibrio sp.]